MILFYFFCTYIRQNINVIIQLNGYGSNSNADVEILPRLTQSPRGFNPPHILYNNVAYTDDVRSHNLILTPIHTVIYYLLFTINNLLTLNYTKFELSYIFLKKISNHYKTFFILLILCWCVF